ncbi:hypothetical protein CRYUN_Cryun04dG0128700 [Craigia yunnanensis]
MEGYRMQMLALFSFMLLKFPPIYGWGTDGHSIVCRIAQSHLSEAAADTVQQLLPKSAEDDLGSVCAWADQAKFRYRWSSPLHFLNTPDTCTYQYKRDGKDEDGEIGRCVAGAINNYTSQLLSYNSAASEAEYNLTEALLFLSHFMGDIHQPLHVGFASDKGGNTIDVHWYTRKEVLHHVWDSNIIETAEERFYDSNIDDMVDAIQQNITVSFLSQLNGQIKSKDGRPAVSIRQHAPTYMRLKVSKQPVIGHIKASQNDQYLKMTIFSPDYQLLTGG